MSGPLRVAAVRFTNALPLVAALAEEPGVELRLETPRRCAELVAAGACDVGLVPVFELLARPELRPLGRGVIAARARADTVLLLADRPLEALEVVVEDPASRSSNALAALLLRGRYGLDVPVVPAAPPDVAAGRVLIGDAAFRAPAAAVRLDLGAEWRAWTGLPFVFARWATARADPPRAWAATLDLALERGLGRLGALGREAARRLDLPAPLLEEYLSRTLDYTLRPPHVRAITTFAARLVEHGLLPAPLARSHA